jgi:acetoin utilization protein AcuB
MLVRDRMTAPPITMDVRGSIAEAHGLMRHYQIRRVPVLRKGQLVGIVSWTDLMRAMPSPATLLGAQEMPGLLLRAGVREIMTADPTTVAPDQPIEDAALIMRQHKIGGLPVVEGGALVGMITESDIFQAFVDLTGVRGRGTRLVVALSGHHRAVTELVAAIDEAGQRLVSIATYVHEGEPRAIVRVDTDNPVPLVHALAEKLFKVVHISARAPSNAQPGPSPSVRQAAEVRPASGVNSRPQ